MQLSVRVVILYGDLVPSLLLLLLLFLLLLLVVVEVGGVWMNVVVMVWCGICDV